MLLLGNFTTLKIVKRGSLDFLKSSMIQNINKIEAGTLWRQNKFEKMRIWKQSDSAEIPERGDPLGFLALQFAAKYDKN